MPETTGSYFSRALALVRRDKGWIKPLLLNAVAQFVPIAGFLGTEGYILEWARLTAWGVDSSPKQKDIQIGECIKSGFRGVIAGAGYTVVASLVTNLINTFLGPNIFVSIIAFLIATLASVAAMIASLRATIYQSYDAGYKFERMKELAQRDPDGLKQVTFYTMLTNLVAGVCLAILTIMVFVPTLVGMAVTLGQSGIDFDNIEMMDNTAMRYIFFAFLDNMTGMIPALVLLFFVYALALVFVRFINQTMVALWMRQFNVPAWGASDDPLPYSALPPTSYQAPDQNVYQGYAPMDAYGQQPMDTYQDPQAYVPQQPYAEQQPYVDPQAYAGQQYQPYPQEQAMPQQPVYQAPEQVPVVAPIVVAPEMPQPDQSAPVPEAQPIVMEDIQLSAPEPIQQDDRFIERIDLTTPATVEADTDEAAETAPVEVAALELEPEPDVASEADEEPASVEAPAPQPEPEPVVEEVQSLEVTSIELDGEAENESVIESDVIESVVTESEPIESEPTEPVVAEDPSEESAEE